MRYSKVSRRTEGPGCRSTASLIDKAKKKAGEAIRAASRTCCCLSMTKEGERLPSSSPCCNFLYPSFWRQEYWILWRSRRGRRPRTAGDVMQPGCKSVSGTLSLLNPRKALLEMMLCLRCSWLTSYFKELYQISLGTDAKQEESIRRTAEVFVSCSTDPNKVNAKSKVLIK